MNELDLQKTNPKIRDEFEWKMELDSSPYSPFDCAITHKNITSLVFIPGMRYLLIDN